MGYAGMRDLHRDGDVLVVGAGPAGSATAAGLAMRGYDVLVLDREHFPRDKPCGEFINPAGAEALARLGVLGAVEAHGPSSIRGWEIHPRGSPSLRALSPAVSKV